MSEREKLRERIGERGVRCLERLQERLEETDLPAVPYHEIDAKRKHWERLADRGYVNSIEETRFVALTPRGEEAVRKLNKR